MKTARRRQPRYTAADWPFWRPGSNPVASETPSEVLRIGRLYFAGRCLHEGRPQWTHDRPLIEVIEASPGARNKYHRAGDWLFGLFDHGRSTLSVIPAFSRLYSRS